MTEPLTISSFDELIATISHLLGFKPAESMVCVAIGPGPTTRIDIPGAQEDLDPWVASLTEVYLRKHHPGRVALVAFGDDGRRTVEALSVLGEALAMDPNGPEVGPVLWVKGEEWTELLTATHGAVSASAQARIDAEYAVRGRVMPARSREELAATMHGDPHDVSVHLPHAREQLRRHEKTAVQREARWVGARIRRFLEDRVYLDDADAARLLAAVSDTTIRDAAMLSMRRTQAPLVSELWQDLLRRAPAEVRDTPATLLALSSYIEGNGAKAWTALDQLSEPNPLSQLVESALVQAIDPSTWDQRYRAELERCCSGPRCAMPQPRTLGSGPSQVQTRISRVPR